MEEMVSIMMMKEMTPVVMKPEIMRAGRMERAGGMEPSRTSHAMGPSGWCGEQKQRGQEHRPEPPHKA
jgi:hypothetical protein